MYFVTGVHGQAREVPAGVVIRLFTSDHLLCSGQGVNDTMPGLRDATGTSGHPFAD